MFDPVSVSRIKMHIIRVVLVLHAFCQCNAAGVSRRASFRGISIAVHVHCTMHMLAKEAAARESCCATGALGMIAAVNSNARSCVVTSHESRVTSHVTSDE